MKEEAFKVISISQLVQTSSPVTSASSLNPSTSNSPSKSSPHSFNNNFERYRSSNLRNPNPKILKPLNLPTILIGTITPRDPSTSNSTSCLLFSDGSATIACDILDFELRVVRKRIHVLAWNFIPLEWAGGFLEIIRWCLPESTSELRLCSSNSVAYSLSSGLAIDCQKNSKSRYYVHGQMESVSSVAVVPCKMGVKSDSRPTASVSEPNASRPGNIFGFLTQILVCDSKSCRCKDSVLHLQGNIEGHGHSCSRKSITVYFCGSASSWHPLLSRLVGNVVSLSGLKKKLVFIGKEESRVMYLTTDKATFHYSIAHNPYFTFQKSDVERGKELGMYTGTITDIYMEGMVVELDEQVMLLLTDQELTIPLSVRVGAIVFVRNVHFVNPKFSWTKGLVLGACCKTSICVKAFSPMDSGCHILSQSQSPMRKFINSLPFSARLWVLLMVSCFGKKFSGVLPEKQIFGSKHREGWAQKHSSTCLPLSIVRSRHGVFTEYCNHGSRGCGSEQNYGRLKLAVPLSNFIRHCEATWKKLMLEQKRGSNLVCRNKQYGFLSCEGKLYSQSIRRVLHSEDLGVALIGKIKISPPSGKLQLVDATGGIDVVIPELSSTWCSESIYEMHDFTVVLEGVPRQSDSLETPLNESFLCSKSIFSSVQLVRESSLSTYIFCHLRDETSRNRPLCPGTECNTSVEDFGSGRYHLLCATHKFPALRNRSTVFAEAIVLPLDLFISENDGDNCPTMIETCYREGFASKRFKTDVAASSGTHLNSCNLGYMHEIPCFVTGKILKGHCPACSETLLHSRKANLNIRSGGKNGSRKVLLEFDLDSFCKYEVLKIGGHYIAENHNDLKSGKLIITAKTHLWSVLFSSDEVFPKVGQHLIPTFEEDSLQIKLPLLRFSSADSQLCSDRCVFLSCDDFDLLTAYLKEVKDGLVEPLVSIKEVDKMITAPLQSSRMSTCHCRMPEGNLISLKGFVVGVHDLGGESCSCGGVHNPDILGIEASNVCIHVQVDNRIVKIFSSLSKIAYPTGFGPGASATFHRILVKRRNKFMMTAASFVVINSVTLDEEKYSRPFDNPLVMHNFTTPEGVVPASMVSQLIECSECKPVKLHCQAVALYALVLQNNTSAVHSQTGLHSKSPIFDIPLAGFILDDGSSVCCCWTNSKSAATLLRLHVDDGKTFSSPISHHVGKILGKHERIVVKNYGSMFDSSDQDLRFFACSGKKISCSDKRLLKLVILNSCFTSSWSVVGSIMDSNAMELLGKQLTRLNMTMTPHFRNIWAIEVVHSDPVKKARSILEELLNAS